MEWAEIESKMKDLVYAVSKKSTANLLNVVDLLKENDNITIGESKRLEELKKSMRSAIMNYQNEMLAGVKCLIETGDIPKAIDKRNVQDNKD
jgi:hypothetical protein